MLIAHLPLGYLIGRSLARRYRPAAGLKVASLVGSVAPDVDLLRFYLLDNGQFNHRFYFTHWPSFWLLGAVSVLPILVRRRHPYLLPSAGFFPGVLSHLVTDSVAAPIRWFAPFSDRTVELVHVEPTHDHILLSLMANWTFLIELDLIAIAGIVWLRDRRTSDPAD